MTKTWFTIAGASRKNKKKKKRNRRRTLLNRTYSNAILQEGKIHNQSFSKVFPNWRHDGRRKRLLESEKCSRTRNFSSHRGFDDDTCLESFALSLAEWFPKFRRHYIPLKFCNHSSNNTASQAWRYESSITTVLILMTLYVLWTQYSFQNQGLFML